MPKRASARKGGGVDAEEGLRDIHATFGCVRQQSLRLEPPRGGNTSQPARPLQRAKESTVGQPRSRLSARYIRKTSGGTF
eukprot:1181703-Prorocentrum_minimum.AAC.7